MDIEMDDILDVESLAAAVRDGFRPKFLFFWGHQPQANGRIGKGCLSQWWPSSFEMDGVLYRTAEHYMMAEKARLFGDEAARERIIAASHPGEAKQIGREVQDFDEQLWTQHRFDIVVRGNLAKFGQHEDLKAFLLSGRNRVLVEASPVDRIWGIGLAEDDVRAQEPEAWQGLNLLGFALMAVRNGLGEENNEL